MAGIETVYIEDEIANHPRTQAILARLPRARRIACDRYGEVFNPKSQNFRLQKQQPALILARKHDGRVLETPAGYGVGGNRNYYFSHMLNCVYDCRYCFLQGMYRSAHYVLFVNYEDFETDIDNTLQANASGDTWFFSGYDCDSLALEPVSGFIAHVLPFFAARPNAHLEIRTKSTQTRALAQHPPLENVVVAFSFTPEVVSNALEHKVPRLEKRIHAMQDLQRQGWNIGLRFDPLIYCEEYPAHYRQLFRQVFAALDPGAIHSISFGPFRLPKPFHQNIVRLYPDEALFAGRLTEQHGMVSYPPEIETNMRDFCQTEILQYVHEEKLFPCSL